MWYRSGPILFEGVFVPRKTLCPLFASSPDLRWQTLMFLCCARISGQPEFNWLIKMSPPLKIHFIYGGYLLFDVFRILRNFFVPEDDNMASLLFLFVYHDFL